MPTLPSSVCDTRRILSININQDENIKGIKISNKINTNENISICRWIQFLLNKQKSLEIVPICKNYIKEQEQPKI